jgi:hypothetical protein
LLKPGNDGTTDDSKLLGISRLTRKLRVVNKYSFYKLLSC